MTACLMFLLLAQATGEVALSGRITDSVTHQPVAGALVQYQGHDAMTHADGAWSLNVRPFVTDRQLIVSKKGYADVRQYLTLKSGTAESHDFELSPAAHIFGRVVDRDSGAPIAGFIAVARGSLGTLYSGRETGRDGAFAIQGDLAPGSYVLEFRPLAGAQLYGEKAEPDPPGYGQTWFPGVPRADMAAPVVLLAGENREIEMKLQKRERRHISAIVQAPEGREAEPVAISISTPGRGVLVNGRKSRAGPFRIEDLDDGSYELSASLRAVSAEKRAFALTTVEINGNDVDDLKLTMRPGVSIRAEVTMAEQDGQVPGGVRFYLNALPSSPARALGAMQAAMKAPPLRIEGFPPGEYVPHLALPAGYVVASASYNGRTALDTPIDIESPESTVDFVVTSRPAGLRGIVRDANGKPISDITVRLEPELGQRKLSTQTDANGAFHIGNLAPGKYKAVAEDGPDEAVELDFGQTAGIELHVK